MISQSGPASQTDVSGQLPEARLKGLNLEYLMTNVTDIDLSFFDFGSVSCH